MSKYLNDAYTLRMPSELKSKIAESAKAYNRSMNADIVARLEQSFKADKVYPPISQTDRDYLEKINNIEQALNILIENVDDFRNNKKTT